MTDYREERTRRRPSPKSHRQERRRERSPPRKPRNKSEERPRRVHKSSRKRLLVENLSRTVQNAHINEIFGNIAEVKNVEMFADEYHREHNTGISYVSFRDEKYLEEAKKIMDGGQIDGKTISVKIVD